MLKSLAVAVVTLVVFATPALAGPPLICHPFVTESGKLIAWGSGPGWNTPDHSYDIKKLVADTTAALTPESPVLTRMENLRRATIYAMRDAVVAEQLLRALMHRALSTSNNGSAWFDAGYLVEAYRQGEHMRNDRKNTAAWAAVDATIRVDGYGFVKKAIAQLGPSAEMEFAASLMTQGAVAEAHRARAAKAGAGSLVARNLAKLAY
ncbi:MAG TPA: hypothetical protein VJ691_03195 [Vicinamibacterales bacterium]|nr:hypothetical protein [Vicinamibacterales bacterium]